MKTKSIKKVIHDKIEDWINSIEDEDVKKIAKENVVVTGGCITSMLLRERINDFDVYFRTKEAATAIVKYYTAKFKNKNENGIQCPIGVDEKSGDRIRLIVKSAGIASEEGSDKAYQYFEGTSDGSAGEYVGDIMQEPGDIEDLYEETKKEVLLIEEGPKYRPIFLSTNAITLSHRIQLVFRFYGEPDQLHENYDFVHCTNYWTSWNNELVLRPAALESILTRELKYTGSKYPVCSIIRLRKFIARGWTINAGQILKMVMQVSELDMKDYKVLTDQLTGVDSLYFKEVLNKLKEKNSDRIESSYLVEIIDRMF